jgi:hypothetical protein
MKTSIKWIILLLTAGSIISGCSPKAKYDRMLKHELASGIRNDSLFLGLYFGMPEKEFYTHCWNLNKKGLIRQGETNITVLYELKNQLKSPAQMDFYPKFNQGKISEMPVRFKYTGWAPWNKELSSDILQLDILKWYEKTYGGGFLEVRHPTKGALFVKVSGNRQITIFKQDELYVWAIFTDMLVKKSWTNSPINDVINQDTITKDLKK